MPSPSPTIAAIATGTGGGIGVIRVSGPTAADIGRQICVPWPTEILSHHLYPGRVMAPLGGPIDRVLFCLMRAPRSYTGEDVLEIHGHGGPLALRLVLEATLGAGAVPAAPGEFTRRAFLAGKLDLTQAEAVVAMIGARSVQATRQAERQLGGELGRLAADLRRRVVTILSDIEGTLDFPDVDADHLIVAEAGQQLGVIGGQLEQLALSFQRGGKAMQQGIEVALIGRTNAGKSSLVNALCGVERVLVDPRPGTTRDYVEVQTEWDGLSVTLIDTAGERPEAGDLERQGLRLGRERWRRADLLLVVADGTCGLTADERRLIGDLGEQPPRLLAWNKLDEHGCLPPPPSEAVVCCSALCGWGLDEMRRRIVHLVAPEASYGDGMVLINARQATVFAEAAAALGRAQAGLSSGTAWDLVATDLRQGASRLGEVTGEEVTTAVVDAIFARFCLGK